jgi:error-prone DNA polymerase
MIPLRVHSHYSLMRGTASIAALCRAARRRGFQQLALTDTDNLYGLFPFLEACRREEITPIIGAVLTSPRNGRQAVCLVENDAGYTNLCRLLTNRHCNPAFSLQGSMLRHHHGLTILTAEADLLRNWHDQGVHAAAALACKPDSDNIKVYRQARRLGIAAVAVPASFFLNPEDFHLHRLLRAIAANTTLCRLPPHETSTPAAFLGSTSHYQKQFAIWPETIDRTRQIGDRCHFRGPRFGTVMPPYVKTNGPGAAEDLRQAAYAGARRRYGDDLSETVIDRLEHELRIITTMGFASYFLVVRDIVRQSSRTCGRGSGAASLVAYCLHITNVCPIRHNLYFERFLNPGRRDPPDIDIDFAWDERDAIIANVLTAYGDHAAMVCNHVALQPRLAIREIARVYGLPAAEISRITKRLPWLWRQDETTPLLLDQLRQLPTLKDMRFPPPWPDILQAAQRLIGSPRYLSVHPGGVVITPRPVREYVPVEIAAKGVPIIQWEKDSAEEAGLVKIDLLGNRSLGVIRDAIADLRHTGIAIAENQWQPEEDRRTQDTIAHGRTMGCFYIESPAMRLLQQKAAAGDFEHLVIHSSIIRPAANEFIREYIRRLHGGAWQPLHPILTEVLAETFGIMVFQEDVSRVAVALAGFSHADADGLRKIMSKKDRHRQLTDYRERFFQGAGVRGVSAEITEKIWQMMMSFDGYSFCKPHSASYAKVSFQAAYLKTHFPAEFMAAVINNQGGYYSTFAYVSEARRLGLTILPPDVQISDSRWTGSGRELRVGLLAVRHLSHVTRERLLQERRRQPFRSLEDFCQRTRPAEPEGRALIHAGALDSLNHGRDRTALLWHFTRWQQNRASSYAGDLFGVTGTSVTAPLFPPTNYQTGLRREFAALGFLVRHHPMELCNAGRPGVKYIKAAHLPNHVGANVCCAGWLITGKAVQTKHGDVMEFLTFEDETDIFETTFFPQVYKRYCHLLDSGRPFRLTGKVEEDYGAVTLTVTGVEKLFPAICAPGAGAKDPTP